MKRFLFIIMENGMIYVEAHIFHQQEKLENIFKLTKVSGAYWRGDSKMKCCKEFMEHLGVIKKN